MASLDDYKRHIQVLKMEQKIERIQRELESVNYGDGCPLHGENDCAEVRKAYDRGYVSGLYEALTLFKVIEADTPQTKMDKCYKCKWWNYSYGCSNKKGICDFEPTAELVDRKTENSSEKPNNCEHITEDGVTCAKYPACDDCLDNPLNKVKGSERLVKGSEKPNNSKERSE